MIVKMKKVYLVVLESAREKALEKMRELGVVHVEREYKSSESVNSLVEKKSLFEKCILALSSAKETKSGALKGSISEAEELAGKVGSLLDDKRELEDENEKLKKEIASLAPWGDFNPADIKMLDGKGISIKLYELSREKFQELPEDIKYTVIKQVKNTYYIACISFEGEETSDIAAEQFFLPSGGIRELEENLSANKVRIADIEKELAALSAKKGILETGLRQLEELLEFESVKADMGADEGFSYISGYVPEEKVENLKKEAYSVKWALLVRDPEEDETPPTLVKNPKWVSIIQPLFGFLDTTPGYRELDISMLFLMFFTVFVAMIVGDAGYGIVFLTLTLLMRAKLKSAPSQVFVLLSVLSFATIVWGTITGTWFGAKTLAEIPFLKMLIIPQIASFSAHDTTEMIKQISFIIGITHLTIGILLSFARKMPSLSAIAEIGWLLILYAMYFAARFFVLGVELNPLAMYLFAAGFVLVLLFSEQNGKNIFKGMLMGIAWSPMKFLDSVSMFADLVSYIRLFAVGLATVAVAQSFNSMASGFEGVTGMIISAVILFFAHTFNMAMSLLSVIVHGVRLNMLEFGGKIGMEWSGYAYNPFRKKGF